MACAHPSVKYRRCCSRTVRNPDGMRGRNELLTLWVTKHSTCRSQIAMNWTELEFTQRQCLILENWDPQILPRLFCDSYVITDLEWDGLPMVSVLGLDFGLRRRWCCPIDPWDGHTWNETCLGPHVLEKIKKKQRLLIFLCTSVSIKYKPTRKSSAPVSNFPMTS